MKRNLLIFVISIFLVLALSCSNDIGSSKNTGTVRLTVNNVATRSILPSYPDIKGYKVTLSNDDKNYTGTFSKDDSIIIEEVLIGTYAVTVNAYSDDSYSTEVAMGTTTLTVNASSDSTATVNLDWLSDGNGSFTVVIDWSKLTNENNAIYEAIKIHRLGFVAWDIANNKAFNDADIQWVSDFSNKSYTYKQENIPTTKSSRSTSISFKIYTISNGAAEAIAETFNTAVTILPNINSESDGNDSFEITNNNITSYIKNVSNVKAELNDEDSAKYINISWEYPKLSDGTYVLTAWITNNSDSSIVDKQTFEYAVSQKVATGATSAVFTGLDPAYIYTVHFKNETKDSAVHSYSAEITPITDIKTKVKVQSISFESSFLTSYIMGNSVTVGAVINPEDATYKGYSVSVTEGAEASDKIITFPVSGDYVITLTSEDEDAVSKTAEMTVTVKLVKPELTAEKTDAGISLSWNSVSSSTGYTILKSFKDKAEEIKVTAASYVDSDVATGIDYTYQVKATREDSKFDSEYSNEVTANISNSVITVVMPDDVERESFSSVISNALNGQYVTDDSGISLNIDLSGSSLLSSADSTFSWYLNGVKLGEDNSTALTIDSDTAALNISSSETSNNLQLQLTKGLYTYSASTTLHYIEVDPGTVTIEGDDQVTYGVPSQLKLVANGNPIVIWSSSDEAIATVDSNGIVTSLEDGEVTIKAEIVATGKTAEKTIKSYIPVKSVSFKELPSNFLIIEKSGVSITNTSYKTIDLKNYVEIETANGKKASNTTQVWSISNNNNSVTFDNGLIASVNSGNAGAPTVKLTVDGVEASLTVPVYNFDITYNGNAVTGNNQTLKGEAFSKNSYTVYIAVNSEALSSSSNSALKGLATYEWDISRTGGTVSGSHEFTPGTYDATLAFGADAASYLVKAIIKVNNSEVANISFTRNA